MSAARSILLVVLLALCSLAAAQPPGQPVQLRPGLYAGGQPDAAQLRELAGQGVTTVIDLRGAGEARGYDEVAAVRDLGLHYVALPIEGEAAINAANARALQHALEASDGPVLLHCASGNRVGALLALAAHQGGASEAASLAQGRAAGLRSLEPVVRQRFRDGEL